jgi:hypothetical protein
VNRRFSGDTPALLKLLAMALAMRILSGMAEQHPKKTPARGSIQHRGGSFRVRVCAGTNPETGKPHYLTETHTDLKEAEKARTRLVALADARKAPLSNNTFAVAVRQRLDSRQAEVDAGELSATTLADYEQLARDHVIPVLGTITMGELDRQLVPAAERLYGALLKCKIRCGKKMTTEHYPSGRANSRILRGPELDRHTCGKRWGVPPEMGTRSHVVWSVLSCCSCSTGDRY